MEPVEVTARFDPQGVIIPLSFLWHGQSYAVISTGRRWEQENRTHILVMTPPERVFELVLDSEEGRWYLKRVGLDRSSA